MKTDEAAHAAAYVLYCAKQWVPYCGGTSEIMILDDDKGWSYFPPNQIESISLKDLESDFGKFQLALRDVIAGLGNFGLDRGVYDKSLKAFVDQVTKMRKRHSVKIEKLIQSERERQEELLEDFLAEESEKEKPESAEGKTPQGL
ncbi:MAG: hypothetical protein LAO04_11560 [Acidobacteriia bacterium]|nr:hypothetical protein [Terriglobia bacterium]